MRPLATTACLCLLAAITSAAARPQVGGETAVRVEAKSLAARYRTHLRALTAAEMEGRPVGGPGGKLAIDYVEREMRRCGLRPLPGLGRSRIQAFSVPDPTPRRPLRETALDAALPAGSRVFRLGADFTPFGFSPNGELRGEIVFVGYGLQIPELGRDDYASVDVRGKIALILRGAPGWPQVAAPLRSHRRAMRFSTKIASAHERGAIGVLFADRSAANADRDLISIAATARGEADIPAVCVRREVAEALLVRTRQGLAARQRILDDEVETDSSPLGSTGIAASLRVAMEPFRPELETANVVGLLVGDDPALAEEYVVIGAHHDHVGRGEFRSLAPEAVGQVHPGADDNASGVAALLTLAWKLQQNGWRPKRSLVLVAFGAEEMGLSGSRSFLQDCPVPRKQIVAMINMDMIGRATPDRLRVEGVGSAKGLPGLIGQVEREVGMKLNTRETVTARSDHWSFIRAGIPSLFLHSGLHDEYHRPTDVACLVLVPEALGVVRVVEAVTRLLSGTRERLEFRPDVVRKSFLK